MSIKYTEFDNEGMRDFYNMRVDMLDGRFTQTDDLTVIEKGQHPVYVNYYALPEKNKAYGLIFLREQYLKSLKVQSIFRNKFHKYQFLNLNPVPTDMQLMYLLLRKKSACIRHWQTHMASCIGYVQIVVKCDCYTMIYMKKTPPLTHNRYEQEFEYMFVFSKGKPNRWNPIMIPKKYMDTRTNKAFTRNKTNECILTNQKQTHRE